MMRVHILKPVHAHQPGDTPWMERTLARRLCDNNEAEPYVVLANRMAEAKREDQRRELEAKRKRMEKARAAKAANERKTKLAKERSKPKKKSVSVKSEKREKAITE